MIKYTNADKTLVVPSGLGNFGQSSGSGGGVTPQQAAEIASAVTEAAIDEYDTELQVELEEIREAISGNTDTLLDLATIAAMSIAERVALFDEIYEKATNGEKIYIKGLVQEETIRTAILPLVSYRPETNPVLHQGGYLYFAAKGDTDNVYFHVALSSEGSIDPTSGNIIKRNIYNLPTASAEVKGGVRIGSGLTMTQDTLSVDTTGLVTDGDLAPFIVQQSANTENIATLSAATEAISESLGNYATTATTDALSAVTSALTESVAGKQDTLSAGNGIGLSGSVISVKIGDGLTFSGDTIVVGGSDVDYIIYDRTYIDGLSQADRASLIQEIIETASSGTTYLIRYYSGTASRTTYKLYVYQGSDTLYAHFLHNGAGEFDWLHYRINGISGNHPSTEKVVKTASRTTLGGIKVGSGLVMNGEVMSVSIGEGLAFSGDTLVVSGGSGEQNYVIVDQLSDITNPVEGMLAYVKFKRMNGWIIDASQVDGDFAANVCYDGNSYVDVYHNGEGFHWGWNNGATDWVFEQNIWYKIDLENGLFYAACENPNAYVTPLNGATTASTTAEIVVDKLYLYNGTAWEEKNFPAKEYYLNNMTDAERMALYDEIMDLLGGDSNSPNLPKLYSNYKFFIKYDLDGQRWCEAFFTNFESGDSTDIWFAGLKPDKMSYNMNIHRTCASLHGDGTISYTDTTFPEFSNLANDIYLTLDSNGRLKSEGLSEFSTLAKLNRMVLVYQDENINNNFCSAPLKYFYRKTETIEGQDKLVEYIGGEININGTWYKGAWHFAEYEWDEWTTPDTWTTI